MKKRFVDYATFNKLLIDNTLGSTGVVGIGPAINPDWIDFPDESIVDFIRFTISDWSSSHWRALQYFNNNRAFNYSNYFGADPMLRGLYCPERFSKYRCVRCRTARKKYLIRFSFICDDYLYFFTVSTQHFDLKDGPLTEYIEEFFDSDISLCGNGRRICYCHEMNVHQVICILPADPYEYNVKVNWNALMHALNGNTAHVDPAYAVKRENLRDMGVKLANKNPRQQKRKFNKNMRAAIEDYICWATTSYNYDTQSYDCEDERRQDQKGRFKKVVYRPKITNNPLPTFNKVYLEGEKNSYEERMMAKAKTIATGPEIKEDTVIDIDDDVVILEDPVRVTSPIAVKPIEKMDVIIDLPFHGPHDEPVSVIKPSLLGTTTTLSCSDGRFQTEYKFAYEFSSTIHFFIRLLFRVYAFFHTLRRISGHTFMFLYIFLSIVMLITGSMVLGLISSYLDVRSGIIVYFLVMFILLIGFVKLIRYLNKDQVRVREVRINAAYDIEFVVEYFDPQLDFRREVDTSFEAKESSKIYKFKEKKYDQILVEERDVHTGNWRVIRHYEYMLGTTTALPFDKELLVQLLTSKNTLLTITSEALLERLANSTNLGPFIHYDRNLSLDGPILEDTAKLAAIIVLSSRSACREVNVYNELFQKGGEMRLTSLPNL